MPLIDPVTMSSVPPAQGKASAKISVPIELLPTETARILTNVHPALLLSAYYLRFPALVADPVATLLQSVIPLALCQTVYAVLCLPPAGSGAKAPKRAKLNATRKTVEAPSAKAFVSPSCVCLLF